VVLAGVLVAVPAPVLADAGASSTSAPAGELRARAGALDRREHAALLALYAVETRLARARVALAAAHARLAEVRLEEASAARRQRVVARSLAASQARVARALRTLYVEGEAEPLAVLLGATSLDEALLGIEGLSRAAEQNARLAREARERAAELRELSARLAERRSALAKGVAEAAAGATALERETAAQAAVVSELRRESRLTRTRLAELERQAAAAGRASTALEAQGPAAVEDAPEADAPAEPAVPARATEPPSATRTLVVDAVAYHLPGVTASGIPVGPGVIAVDPAVIPLGTRVFVPGYGPAVAADVGSAVRGALIDLWMPSTADALAWGRRTVTITIYG
jgi:3D (Asp-Asp-Asp) domain-containing protein